MSAVIQGVRAVPRGSTPGAAVGRATLLRDRPVMPTSGDIRVLLMAIKISDREANARRAEIGVAAADTVRQAAAERAREAQERAKEAEEKSGFWADIASVAGTVATVAAVVAAAASVVCTGGASAVAILALAGTLLSASSPLVAKYAGEDAGKVAFYGGLAMSVGAAGYGALGKAAATEAAKVAAAQATKAAATRAAVAAGTTVAARTAEGGARIAEGYARYREGGCRADEEHARADQLEARAAITRTQNDVEDIVALLSELEQSVTRAMHTIMAIGRDQEAVQQTITKNVGRRMVWA